MQNSETLLLLNSCLLMLVTLSFAIIGYFFKELHADFKIIIDRVNTLYTKVNTHVQLSDHFSKSVDKRLDEHHQRIETLERK